MPGLRPSRITRRLIKIASLGLAGLLAGLLTGCSASNAHASIAPNDTDWRTTSTYASAISSMPPRSAVRSAHLRLCGGAQCATPVSVERVVRMPHKAMLSAWPAALTGPVLLSRSIIGAAGPVALLQKASQHIPKLSKA